MTHILLVHLSSEDPIILETEELPTENATCIIGMHPRRKDNKEVHFILSDVTQVIFPMWRINFIEVLPSGEEEVFKPFRE